jgi:hypothetical protein
MLSCGNGRSCRCVSGRRARISHSQGTWLSPKFELLYVTAFGAFHYLPCSTICLHQRPENQQKSIFLVTYGHCGHMETVITALAEAIWPALELQAAEPSNGDAAALAQYLRLSGAEMKHFPQEVRGLAERPVTRRLLCFWSQVGARQQLQLRRGHRTRECC